MSKIIGVGIGVLLLGGVMDRACSPSHTTASSPSRSKSSSSVLSPTTSSSKQDAYIALLQKWATRDGYEMGDRDTLIEAGNEACSMMSQDPSLGTISASARILDKYGSVLPRKQATALAVAATETLCPEVSQKPSSKPSTDVKSEAGPLQGTSSPLLGIDMPAGSEGVRNVNDFNNDGKPNRFESWEIPLSYDEALTALKQRLQPGGPPLDGIPWEESNSKGTAGGGDRYVDWWWGRDNQPLILIRIQETTDTDGALIKGVRTDVNIERRD